MSLSSWLGANRSRTPGPRRGATSPLRVERLEERDCPSGDYLLVTNVEKHNVLRYDANTGAFVDEFVSRGDGRLNFPWSAVFGPNDGELYVSSGHRHSKGEGTTKAILRYDGETGAFTDEFVEQGQMFLVHAVTFGPDGNLYVGEKTVVTPGNPHQLGGRIMLFNGATGEFIKEFVSLDSGGLKHPAAHVFGPDGSGGLDLYVSDEGPSRILRYDGETGAFIEEFVAGGSGGLSLPNGVIFGPDGNLYVASFGSGSVMRFQGPAGSAPGTPLPVPGSPGADFITAGTGGLLSPTGILFGPDGNGDGHQDLYVANVSPTNVQGKLGNVKRYDGVTGSFIDTFVAPRSGGLDDPSLMTFTATDPTTLAYTGTTAEPVTAIRISGSTSAATFGPGNRGREVTNSGEKVFALEAALAGALYVDGSVHFVFSRAFAEPSGAGSGLDSIRLPERVNNATVTRDGLATERDDWREVGLVFEEETPFRTAVHPDSELLDLQWRELPTFDLDLVDYNPLVH